jgi:mannitol/fructose-specific phosphotransferase system IIA component (Ntr-type)
MPGKITPLLDPARITLHVKSTQRADALAEIAHLLETHPQVTNFAGFYAELLARDRLDTTSLGNGVSLPHARTEHVKAMVLAVGRSDTGITVDQGGETARLFFVLGTPKSSPGDYLAVVSALCRILRVDATRAALLTAATPEEFIGVIRTAEEKLATPGKPTVPSPSNGASAKPAERGRPSRVEEARP